MTVTERQSFAVHHDTVVRISEQSEQVQGDARTLADAIVKYKGIEWVDGHGGGGGFYPGLDERLSERLEHDTRMPRCGEQCTVELIADAGGGSASDMQVRTLCLVREFATKQNAEHQQLRCETVHSRMPGYIADELHEHATNIRYHERELKKAQNEVESRRAQVESYV